MTIDYTRLRKKLNPEPGAEDVLRIRVGVVDGINADGTVDVVLSGVTVLNVPRMAGAAVQEGSVVQILSQRGGLLILGPVAGAGASVGLGLWARGRSTSASAAIGTSFTSVLNTNTVTFIRNRAYEIKTHAGVSGVAGSFADIRAYRSTGVAIGEWYRFPIPTASGTVFNATGSGIYFAVSNAGNVSGAVHIYVAASAAPAGNVVHFASASQERNVEVWDVGDTSQFPGIVTW